MPVAEISQPSPEMAFTRPIAEQKFRAREETINEHLVKLLAFEVVETTQAVWKKELKNHLSYLAKIRIKTQGLVPERFVRNWLYADPFDENEVPYVSGFIEMHADDYVRNDKTPQAIAERIKEFWGEAAPAIAKGSSPRDLVDRL